MTIALLKSHPYCRHFEPTILVLGAQKFKVKWRNFDTTKMDLEFPDRERAEAFVRALKERCHLITDEFEIENFQDCSDFWYDIERAKKR
jgi:hypothetical protein